MELSSSVSWNKRLRQERTLRNWRQQDLADQLGTTVVTIRRWERGSQHPSAYFRVKLCALFGLSAEEFGFAEPAPQPLLVSGEAFKGPEFLHAPALQSEALSSDLDEGCSASVQEPGGQVLKTLPSQRSHQLADRDWEHMLRRLRRSYKELLDQSLHGLAWMELGLSEKPDLVRNVTNLLFRLPQGGEHLLPPGMGVLDAYDEAEGELLILGAPGAGKSTLLVDLAQQLVDQALAGESPLLPVILRLSSWAIRRPALADWMIKQLSQTYDVPRKLSERWVNEGRLLPLLDGLDEMEEAARSACIAAINTYHRTYLAPLVVCSRQAEYEGAAPRERLALQSAVIVQPLTSAQIEGYLDLAEPSFAGIRTALYKQQNLWRLASTPLMLSVMLLTYRDVSAEEIAHQGTDLEQQVWTDYVVRQVQEKGNLSHYPLKHIYAWLSFLAQQLRTHQQTTFYAEHLHLDWLPSSQQHIVTRLATGIPSMMIGACASLLVSIFTGDAGSWAAPMSAVLGGFIGSSLTAHFAERPTNTGRDLWSRTIRHLRNAMLLGILAAAIYGFYFHSAVLDFSVSSFLRGWLRDACIFGLGSILSGWMFQAFLSRVPKLRVLLPRERHHPRVHFATQMNTRVSVYICAGAILGTGIGLSYTVGNLGLTDVLSMGLLNTWLSEGLRIGLSISVTVTLVGLTLDTPLRTLRFAERIHWSWRSLFRLVHLQTTVMVTVMVSLLYGLSDGPIYEPSTGLSFGLSFGLIYWLILGLYQGIEQKHLEDQSRSRFNQGIQRSLRNSLLLSLISAIIITAMAMVSNGVSFGLLNGVSFGLSSGLREALGFGLSTGLSFGLILLLAGMVVMWALSGGLTILRHYVIRWSLARHQTFPFRATAFLDDTTSRILMRRVGGGYSFIHRRLQDYFADAAQPHGAGEERATH